MEPLIIDVSPILLEAMRNLFREELDRKSEELRRKPRTFTRQQICELANMSLPTVDKHIKSGRLKAEKIGRKIYIPESSLNEFLGGSSPSTTSKNGH